jgi:DNA-binding CsgD family transcriptional regulator
MPSQKPTAQIMAPAPISFGAGRYVVQRLLGDAGQKRVYLARDSRLQRDVAIAVIKAEGLDTAALARVRAEAQAMGRLGAHPHIVTLYDAEEEDGQTFVVQEFMEGGSVEDLLQELGQQRMALDQALRISAEVCEGLEHAHEMGVIHRDIKPGNVWFDKRGTAKVGDFGLAFVLNQSRITSAGMILGTTAYMAPEQAVGSPPDARSDLYAFGAMLYELVTGRPPFLGDDAVSVISQHINTAPVAPSWHNPDVPEALESLILRLLAKAPGDRPKSAKDVREELIELASAATLGIGETARSGENPVARLASGVFVGREQELVQLRAGLDHALSGRGRLLLLVGEAGIGKTRTAGELATYAQLRGCQVLWGRCYEGDGAPVYWPWIQVIRLYVHDRDPEILRSEMGTGGGVIAKVVSEIREQLPDLPEPPDLDPEAARFRLFDSITTFFKSASMHQPLVLVLDDLHWADRASLLMLEFLVRELAGSRILIIGTYRDVELGRHHPLSQALGEFARQQSSQLINMSGMTEVDVARFIEMTAGVQREGLAASIFEGTEGNPFFVNEVVRLLAGEGRLEGAVGTKPSTVTIPEGVRQVVARRLGMLSDTCNELLSIAAVMGKEFSFDPLVELMDAPRDQLLQAIEEAVAARILFEVPDSPGRYAFSHSLYRESLYDELLTARRIGLHQRIAEVLERLYATKTEPHLDELAYHCFEGLAGSGDVGKVIDYSMRAARRADSLLAYEEASLHLEHALQALERKELVDERERCELLLSIGETQWKAGAFDRARETFLKSADLARSISAADYLARSALGLGGSGSVLVINVSIDEVLINLLEESLAGLSKDDDVLRAKVMARLAEALTFAAPFERRISLSREAEQMARRAGDNEALTYVLERTFWAIWLPDTVDQRLAAATEIVDLAKDARKTEIAVEGHVWRFNAFLELGNRPATDEQAEIAFGIAEQLRQPYWLWITGCWRALMALLEGRSEEVEQLALGNLAIGQRTGIPLAPEVFAIQLFVLRRQQNRLDELQPGMKAYIQQYPAMPAWRCALSELYCELGRESQARDVFDDLGDRDVPRDPLWLVSMALLSMTCAFLKDTRRAETLYNLIVPFADHCVTVPTSLCTGSTSFFLGLLATTLRRWDQATQHFNDALAVNADIGSRPWVAETQQEFAAMLLLQKGRGDRRRAFDLLDQALTIARELGMKRLLDKLVATAEENDIAIVTDDDGAISGFVDTRTKGRAARPTSGTSVLTRRESEILALVAEGKTNRAIAEKLVLSEKTVARHVANIFAKIDVDTRAGAAAWAVRSGLASSPGSPTNS